MDFLRDFVRTIATYQWTLISWGILGAITTTLALMWSKFPIRWILAIAVVGVVILVFRVDIPELDPQLPSEFLSAFRLWLLVLGLVSLLLMTHFVMTLVRLYRPRTKAEGKFPDIDAAWQEILIQLSQARIDLSKQKLYLLLTPDEALALSVIDAAGLQFFATAPAAAEAPIHCYAVADAIFLSFAGASVVGRQDQEGTARLEYLCNLLVNENPEWPTLRGIAVLLPYEWETGPDSLRKVAAVRDDLQTIRRTFKVRCPTLTVFCLQESLPGFNEFASRLPGKLRHNRCGFSVPTSRSPGAEVFRQGMVWMTQWFQTWTLNLMVQDIANKDGNNRLLNMIATFRWGKTPLVRLLESALTMHQQAEPVLFRGCYFVACGPSPDKQAFAAGLLNGAKGRLLADHHLATWSRDADHRDHVYRRLAWGLGIGTAAIALPIWYYAIITRLSIPHLNQGWVGWCALLLLALTWSVVLIGPKVRRKAVSRA